VLVMPDGAQRAFCSQKITGTCPRGNLGEEAVEIGDAVVAVTRRGGLIDVGSIVKTAFPAAAQNAGALKTGVDVLVDRLLAARPSCA
jgi:hypothetical protein